MKTKSQEIKLPDESNYDKADKKKVDVEKLKQSIKEKQQTTTEK